MSYGKWSRNSLPVHPIASLGGGTNGTCRTKGDDNMKYFFISVYTNVIANLVLGR